MLPALFTDLYALNTAYAYFSENMNGQAVFELSVRTLPSSRNYLIAAGLRSALHYVSGLRYRRDEIDFLVRKLGFSESFGAALRRVRFSGDIYAIPEGTPVFAGEPILQVIAPIFEAQLLETALLNLIHAETLAVTKAHRVVAAARGKAVIECAARRAAGEDAALLLARAMYLAGGQGTSNVHAGRFWNIPVFGTISPSYVLSHDTERAAFEALVTHSPGGSIVVDTYDVARAISLIVELKARLRDRYPFTAIRIASGDVSALSRQARQALDAAGLNDIRIFVSGDLDEFQIERMKAADPPIDMFGVGARLAGSDVAGLDVAYNLVEYNHKGRRRLSAGKTSYPGRKQVFREFGPDGMERDVVCLFRETAPGTPLLVPVMIRGEVQTLPNLEESRYYMQDQVAKLHPMLRSLESAPVNYPVSLTEAVKNGGSVASSGTAI